MCQARPIVAAATCAASNTSLPPCTWHCFPLLRNTTPTPQHHLFHAQGTAFPYPERDRLSLRGLVPPSCLTLETQESRFMEEYDAEYRISDGEAKVWDLWVWDLPW